MSDLINYLTKIRFGVGAISELKEELAAFGIERPLIVTDGGLVAIGLIAEVFEKAGLAADTPVFSETPENPTEEATELALELLKGVNADGIVAIGGGSSIDLAKGVALLATHPGPLETYAAIRGGVAKVTPAVLPLIAVPTTAGTGSEVGRATLITLRNQRKLGFLSPYLIPRVALCDPALTLKLPPRLTAATGVDALSHCVETYLSPKFNPPAEGIALDGLARAWENIRAAVADGSNIDARTEMMAAAVEGALAFQKGLGAIHSTSHALGGLKQYRLHHGTLNAVMMPPVLRFNAPVCEAKYAKMRKVMDLAPETDLADTFTQLNRDLGLPTSLSELGVSPDVIDQVAQWSEEDHSTPTNPRPAKKADFVAILEDAMG
ncbi:iron-containing alcohol dehydrogenase [Acuticoccus sp. M5D2P5]|uniref:iron-containing alcohol dehydrogenase n=1 Tax=Acuticoccus kalidii TaxID=2910977 RepID=UPI001F3D2E03|nr:iron-containing alcohol dehydrogenase [Acuticoccus kalidii]MCF3932422.1 iron-containing alcohol dehydrogenase [Acuticoccus kalidii]